MCDVHQPCFQNFFHASPVQACGANQPFSPPSRLQSVGIEGDFAGLEGTVQGARLPRDCRSETAPRRSSSVPKERPSGSSSTQQAQVNIFTSPTLSPLCRIDLYGQIHLH